MRFVSERFFNAYFATYGLSMESVAVDIVPPSTKKPLGFPKRF